MRELHRGDALFIEHIRLKVSFVILLSISSTTLDKKNGINEDFEFEFAHILDFFLKKIVLFIY
ncbi:MAG: hypothetical protein EAZ75_11180 [Flavobacteriia bacterium]|nr:MAG: hypothetical protein EAZ75_11180 [Flavobacteriia bacterium]